MSKLVLASNPNMAEALVKKVPEFRNAEVIGFTKDVRETIKDKTVLTSYIPDNMVHLPEQVVLCACSLRKETQDLLPVDELTWNLRPYIAFKASQLDNEEAKLNW